MPHAQVNGQRLYYEDTGGDGPAILFSHGLLMDSSMFAPQVQALANLGWRCISWDERAHGQTATGECAPFSYYDSADDAVALLAQLGVAHAVLAGMSQGGYLSLRAALRHPQVVRALVLIDTQAMTEEAHKMAGHQGVVQEWLQGGLSDERAVGIEHLILGEGWEGAAAWRAKWQRMQPGDLLAAFTTLATRDDISAEIARIHAPALVIHGDADQAIDIERARSMAGALPQAQMVVIPGAGHAPNLTHPQLVNQVLLEFLGQLPA
ncbi:alpha/beta fold hydrolase [Pulveribacter suum]|uniref:Alpha/beta hydrolase n=1 Tax=Pulveribacter suum TaxID=2116657 RepID=A0A2P1NH38_9BURK|nr:alpha/beta hydrolase [Pulveribacter suum]AVP56365.1 alpha/beta hydrolase [Pulveribacter suum]